MTKEISAHEMKTELFINEKVHLIRSIVGDGIVINALSGGVDRIIFNREMILDLGRVENIEILVRDIG
jgi:GMP synthase PP-ATPase subunit